MRPELPSILRAYARDLDIAGMQYATMTAVLREAADALDTNSGAHRPRPAPAVCVIDGDAVPGLRCASCED